MIDATIACNPTTKSRTSVPLPPSTLLQAGNLKKKIAIPGIEVIAGDEKIDWSLSESPQVSSFFVDNHKLLQNFTDVDSSNLKS